ncbi:MAG TPA: homoserine kinase [Clostridia bacterium]|nr:homoserine kinase [Clostridia bacterium]
MLEIRVPATSANIGPGFDCLGIALNMYNYFYIEEADAGLEILGCEEAYRNKENLVYRSMLKCFEKLGCSYKQRGLRIRLQNEIPISRGLGSSAACILGGVLAANELSHGKLDKNEILEIATEIEGHPDNLAPAMFGGMTAAIKDGSRIYHESIKLPEGIKFCAIIPAFELSTAESRAVLPDIISYKDGVFNVGRASLLIAALTNGSLGLLEFACKDRLHETYRGKLINNYNEIIEESHRLGSLCTYLSGAGPTIMAILRKEKDFCSSMKAFLSQLENKWQLIELEPDLTGTVLRSI